MIYNMCLRNSAGGILIDTIRIDSYLFTKQNKHLGTIEVTQVVRRIKNLVLFPLKGAYTATHAVIFQNKNEH